VAGVTHETLHTRHSLTPAERQIVLRRLKFGPALPREELAEYVAKVSQEVIAEREVNKEKK
jgi:hypothetical protein